MRTHKLESGIPIPPISRKRGGLSNLFRSMKKGQSVRLPKARRAAAAVAAHKTFGAGKWAVRSNGSHIRVWRTG